MDIFILLVTNCIPLLMLIAAGYMAGKKFNIDATSLADIVIFILTPVVLFGAIARLPLKPEYFLIPLILFAFAALMTLGTTAIAHRFSKDNLANLIGMGASTANTGYFGLPVILALYDPAHAGLYLLMTLALTINESSFGYYVGARGHHSIRESFMKVLKLPALYAVAAGLLVNLAGVTLPSVFNTYWDKFAGSWTVLGMMILGVALSKHKMILNWSLLATFSFTKFIIWPAFMLFIAWADKAYFNLYDADIYRMLLVLGCLPVAANTVAFATQLNVKPGEATMVVLLTTIFAVFYIPLMLNLFG